MEALDVANAYINRLLDIGSQLHEFGREGRLDDGGGQRGSLLELVSVLEDGSIAAIANIMDDRLGDGNDRIV